MSIGRVSAGNGYEYLTGAVRNDAHDYYVGAGEAPGRWTGSGCERLGLAGTVAEDEMANLFGAAAHPTSGEILSTPYRRYRTVEERIAGKIAALGAGATDAQVALVRAEQYRIGDRAPVAGYDCTFSPAKSVSVLWALVPTAQRREIEDAHDAAIDAAFGWLERRALHTRAGRDGVRHLDAEGFVVARFRHRTSRNGDPQLHTHCAVANRVWSPTEQRWRALDGQGLYRERAGADAVYMAAVEQQLTARLGVEFETRGDVREVASVPAVLTQRWSSRRRQILDRYDELTGHLARAHTAGERSRILRSVTLETRRDKVHGGDTGLHERWATEAAELGIDRTSLAVAEPVERVAAELDRDVVAHAALDALESSKARWTYSHLAAALARAADRALPASELNALARCALSTGRVVLLSVADIGDEAPMTRADGVSVYRDPQREQWSTIAILDAEAFLIETASEPDAPVSSRASTKAAIAGRGLGLDQATAVEQILCDPERITVVIGPAGTGKTYTQRAVVDIARSHGREVLGLALSQNAADVLADEAGCRCENIAKARWHNYPFPNGGVVIVDEAAMAGTLDLAWITRTAIGADCKVVFVGDDQQLQSPSAGGIIRTLAANSSTVWLDMVRRFTTPWEPDATIQVRDGDAGVAATYRQHDRLRGGDRDDMTAQMVTDWWDDHRKGVRTLMMAADNDTVAELAGTARALRVADGQVEPGGVTLHDGNRAGRGDLIVTRRNNPHLVTDNNRTVTNRAVWHVTERHPNGALTVTGERHGDRVFLPPDYVAEHVELAYAATGHGAQGRTVDGGRALFDERSTRSSLYVMMTRGRHFNIGYGDLDQASDTDHKRIADNAATLFAKAIGNDDRALSATDQLAADLEHADSPIRIDALHHDWSTVLADTHNALAPDDVHRTVDGSDANLIAVDNDIERSVAYTGHHADDALWAGSVRRVGSRSEHRPGIPDDHPRRGSAEQSHDRIRSDEYLERLETAKRHKPAQRPGLDQDRRQNGRNRTESATDPSSHDSPLAGATSLAGRRDEILSEILTCNSPPQWASPIVGHRWTSGTRHQTEQRQTVGKIAIYRLRYGVNEPGLGVKPSDSQQAHIWTILRHEVALLHSQSPNEAPTVNREQQLER